MRVYISTHTYDHLYPCYDDCYVQSVNGKPTLMKLVKCYTSCSNMWIIIIIIIISGSSSRRVVQSRPPSTG